MKIGLWGGEEAEISTEISGRRPPTNMLLIYNITWVIIMATYVELKINFQKLSEIEIFRKSKDFGRILTSIIILGLRPLMLYLLL